MVKRSRDQSHEAPSSVVLHAEMPQAKALMPQAEAPHAAEEA